MDITKRLFELEDKEYGDFQVKLAPGISRENVIGVRVPMVRKLAKEIYKEGDYQDFLKALPHRYYDENMLHGLIISEMKDYDLCLQYLEAFLPYVDNWAVCDIMSPKVFKKNKDKLLIKIQEWIKDDRVYTCRFAMEMLMSHYLDDDFRPEYLKLPAAVKSDEYYINMMIAWFFATALAKQWKDSVVYLENKSLDVWTHNKTIQKAIESYRITDEQKAYLRTLKIKRNK